MSLRDGWASITRDQERDLTFAFSGAARFVPLIICGGFFLSTLVLLAVGPIDWDLQKPVAVWGFLISAAAALVSGYLWGVRMPVGPGPGPERGPLTASLIVIVGAAVYLVLYLPVVQTTTGTWYPDVWRGLTDAGEAYAANKYANEHGNQLALYVRMLVAPVTILVLPLTLYFWPRLSTAARILGTTCVTLSLTLTIAQGINRGVAELCANVILFLTLVAAAGLAQRSWRRVLRAGMGIVLVAGLFAGYYSITISDRLADDAAREQAEAERDGKDAEETDFGDIATIGVAELRKDSPFFVIVPEPAQGVGLVFDSYLTHGYKGLDLAMQVPFQPTWGLGFSEFVRHNLLRTAGQSEAEERVFDRTYAGQIDNVWPVGQLWATFFIHPASDIGFPGTVVLTGLMGLAFGLSWRDTLTRRDPLACGVLFHLCIAVIYLPANNQLYQGGELAVGFTVLVLVWLWRRRSGSPRRG